MKLSDVDVNFKVEACIQKDNLTFYNVLEAPFKVYGLMRENDMFTRLPDKNAREANMDLHYLHCMTAGGRVRFKTDSTSVAIVAKMGKMEPASHGAFSGGCGFDMYIRENGKENYYGTYIPPLDAREGYEGILPFATKEMREITINFPNYADVYDLYIGLDEDAKVEEASPYRDCAPIIFYGSSITQGGCSSRPGSDYARIISRRYHCDIVNLGFSGSARGEESFANYIANLPMSVFVYDYDHNAPSAEHLEKTHEPFFKIIREKNPDLPIVIMSAVSHPRIFANYDRRQAAILKTYENAIAAGDKNVYYIDGSKIFDEDEAFGCTVEGCHPTDLGFYFMAKAVAKVLDPIFNK